YTLPPGEQARFEDVLRRVRELAGASELLPYTVYETVVGGVDAGFTVMVWRTGLAGFDEANRDPAAAIRRLLPAELRGVLRAESELWRLRPDLTLLPGAGAGTGGAVEGAGTTRGSVSRVRENCCVTVEPTPCSPATASSSRTPAMRSCGAR